MSPLACSLLALTLAPLLVAADAQRNCNEKTFGDKTSYPITLPTVRTPAVGGRITSDDTCNSRDKRLIALGETVRACNADPYGTAPDIVLVNPPALSPMDVVCTDQCPSGAVVEITQYCVQIMG